MITEFAALHAVTGTVVVDPALRVALQMHPRVRTGLMLRAAQMADLSGWTHPAVVVVWIPIRMLQVAVVLPVIPTIPLMTPHITGIPTIPTVITPPAMIPTIPLGTVPAVPLVVLTPVISVFPAAPIVVAAVVVVAPLPVVVVMPVRRLVPTGGWGPAMRRLPTLRHDPTDPADPHWTEVVDSGHPQVPVVQDITEVVPDVVEHFGS